MKNLHAAFLTASVTLIVANTATAAPYSEGDVFASIGSGRVAHLDNNLNLVQVLDSGTDSIFTAGSAFDRAGNFYVTTFSSNVISQFDQNGNLLNSSFASCDIGSNCESIVFDRADNFYVGQADGTRDILRFDSDGNLTDRFDVNTSARGSDWIELAADQTTLYYTSENFEVFTYDTAAGTQGPQFGATGSRPNFALRLLEDDGALVAASSSIERLDAAGVVIDSFDLDANNTWFALNRDPDGATFWSGDLTTGVLAQFDLDTGVVLQSLDLDTLVGEMGISSVTLGGVSVFGEITVGGGGPMVPLPGALILFLTALGGLGATTLRHRNQV